MNFFLITPYSADSLYKKKKEIVENTAIFYQMNVFFGLQPPYKGLDTQSVTNLYRQVDFVIADLSYERPSSYFEVGFVQALAKPVYLIATTGTDIHQVLNREKVSFYTSLDEYKVLIDSILCLQGQGKISK